MEGPADVFREKLAERVRAAGADENGLVSVLAELEDAIDADPRGGDPEAVYAALVAWATLCSDLVAAFYRAHDGSAGVPVAVAAGVQRIARRLRHSLGHVANGLGAAGYSVTIGPRSSALSAALTWRTPPAAP
ncbi:hypothetical protein GCM10023196_092070 [Actinoallomurus vinaceus]|uniref:Uncharacterized protein n=2 Tax=Actinoallomurus vinaceus TaxID=1080074 RepID=A0ABP8USV8_9ACTN